MADMEMIFKQNTEKILLPVLPEKFEINTSYNHQKVELIELGEVNIAGNPNLKTISINSFFPAEQYFFLSEVIKPPYEYVELINKWATNKIPVRFIITTTDINILSLIENFVYGEQDGSRDVYYTLELSEYKQLNVKSDTNDLSFRSSEQPTQNIAILQETDTLWSLACRYYSDGTKWTKIQAANNNIDPKKLRTGMKLVIPK